MNIIGLEVTPGNPGALATGAVPPEKVVLTYGQKLRVTTGFNYRGPAVDITLYGAIGKRNPLWGWQPLIGFDEIINAEAKYKTPNSPTTFVPVTASVDIPITADISPGTDYDLYCKIKEYSKAGYPEVDDIITITGIPPTFKLLEETIYPYAYIYDGPCEVCTFTATSIPFTPASWVSGKMAAAVEKKMREAGGRIMEMRVYVDEDPWRPWTNWRIEVVYTPPSASTAGIATGYWQVIIGIILVIVALIALIVVAYHFIIKPLTRKATPGLEDVKPAWGKETLINCIQDAEEHWERSPTPLETLEGMSEQELRDYLDQIAEEEVPLGVSWLPWAIAGGVGALAIGTVAVLAAKKKK